MQQALNAVPWKSSVKEIAITNKMSFEQVEIVERETMFVLYGFESANDYISNMMREAQVNEEVATTIAKAVDERIFKAVALQLEAAPEEKPAPAPVPPPNLPQMIHNSLPMIEPGEVVHDVPHVETKAPEVKVVQPATPPPVTTPALSNRYPEGFDPYREPLV